MTRAMLLSELLPELEGLSRELAITGLVQDSRDDPHGRRLRRDRRLRHPWPGLHRDGARRGRGSDPVRAACTGRLAGSRRRDPGGQPARAHGCHGRRLPRPAQRDDDHGRRDRHQWQDLHRAVAGAGVDACAASAAARSARWAPGSIAPVVPTGFTTPLVLRCMSCWPNCATTGASTVAMEGQLARARPGPRGWRCISTWRCSPTSPATISITTATWPAMARPRRGCSHWPGLRAAVVNLDDAFGRELFDAVCRRCASSASARAAHTQAAHARGRRGAGCTRHRASICMSTASAHAVRSPLLGRFNVDNLLAVAGDPACAGPWRRRWSPRSLSQLQPIAGRMNRLRRATAASTCRWWWWITRTRPMRWSRRLPSLRAHTAGRLVCVFGCGGERDTGKRPQMAAIAERGADLVDRHRRQSAWRGWRRDRRRHRGRIRRARARHRAARPRARPSPMRSAWPVPDDIVLIAGKGHEPYQEVNGVRHAFDDTAVAAPSALAQARARGAEAQP